MSAHAPRSDSQIRKRSVLIAGHATSVSLEEAFWKALRKIADVKGLSLNVLITEIDAARTPDTPANLSSAVSPHLVGSRQIPFQGLGVHPEHGSRWRCSPRAMWRTDGSSGHVIPFLGLGLMAGRRRVRLTPRG